MVFLALTEIGMPVCAVTRSQYLTTNGWTDLRNSNESGFPFRIYRDEGRSFLQVRFLDFEIYFIQSLFSLIFSGWENWTFATEWKVVLYSFI